MALNQDSIPTEQSFDENANVIKNQDLEISAKTLLEQISGENDDASGIKCAPDCTEELPSSNLDTKSGTNTQKSWQVLFEKDGLTELQEVDAADINTIKSNEIEHNVSSSAGKDCHELDTVTDNDLRLVSSSDMASAASIANLSDTVLANLLSEGMILDVSDTPLLSTSTAKDTNEEDDEKPKVTISSTSPKKPLIKPRRSFNRMNNSWRMNNNWSGRERGPWVSRRPTSMSTQVAPPPGFDHVHPAMSTGRPYNQNQNYNRHYSHSGVFRNNPGFVPRNNFNRNNNGIQPLMHSNPKSSLAVQLDGASKTLEQQFFKSPHSMNRHKQEAIGLQKPIIEKPPIPPRYHHRSNMNHMKPQMDKLDEVLEDIEYQAQGKIVNVRMILAAGRKLGEHSNYELRMRLPASTPLSVVKRIFCAKFYLCNMMSVAKHSTG